MLYSVVEGLNKGSDGEFTMRRVYPGASQARRPQINSKRPFRLQMKYNHARKHTPIASARSFWDQLVLGPYERENSWRNMDKASFMGHVHSVLQLVERSRLNQGFKE